MDELPFNLVDMTYDELMEELENIDAEAIPSDPESIVDQSDDEISPLQNINDDFNILESESDPEFDMTLSVLQANIKTSLAENRKTRDWSRNTVPKNSGDFIEETGIKDTVKNLNFATPGKLFQLFFTDELLEYIVFQTNLYSQQVSNRPKVTNLSEIKVFLGMNLLMGIRKLPSYRDHWSSSPNMNDPFISSLMPVKRFSWLLSNIHLNDNTLMPKKGEQGYDKLYKIRPILNELSKNFESCMAPSRVVAIDESMIKFKGRSSLKQYLPKPIKRGYKVWILANKNGYCQKFQIYTGKTEDSEKGLGARVVKNLLEGMEGRNHIVHFDNFFTGVGLLEYLKSKDIHACGTVNPSRKLLPNFKPDKSLKRGESQILTSDTQMVAIKWRDKRSVHLLSNFHDPSIMTEVDRKGKNGTVEKVPCPTTLVDYNQNMNLVDKFDQNLNVYKIDRRSKKWWHRIFFYLVDASVVNAFILYKELNLEKLSMKDFRREVINHLVAETIVKQKRPSPSSEVIAIKKSKPYVPFGIRVSQSAHQPKRDTRRRCAKCSTSKKQVRTDWICSICNVPLCLGKNKTCFQDYHNEH